eukprot:maker-scaffold2482_size15237-snap-gene-0.3 protein:Tk03824 transcript:maker-scaffold2482_size15237-snap-gene-0.3-mRNA-1 annotation:"condensin-2 complex subunit d3"
MTVLVKQLVKVVPGPEVSSADLTSLSLSSSARATSSGFWPTLMELGINYRALIGLLFHFMEAGQRFEADQSERKLCIRATSLYLVLLALPGSGAFKIFHPVLYQRALSTFKLATKLRLAKFSPKKKNRKAPPKGASQRPRGRWGRSNSITSNQLYDEDFDLSDDDESHGLSEAEVSELANALNGVIYDFHVFLDHHPLKRSLESLELTVSELVELTHLETTIANLDFGHKNRRSDLSALAFNAYCALERICHPLHGDVKRSLLLIFKFLLPAILMTHRGSSEITPKGLTIIREHSLHFVKHLVRRMGEETHSPLEVLVQHMALQVPDKAEFRSKTSHAIVSLMRELPSGQVFNRMVRWFFAWAHSEKVAHRQFSLEVMGRLIQENERGQEPVGASPEKVPILTPDAAQEPSETLDAAKEPPKTLDIETGLISENIVHPLPEASQEIRVTEPSEATVSSQTVKKRSYLGDLVSHKFIFGVIFSRCRDVSATVRAKALQTLADITAANNPIIVTVIQSMMDQSAQIGSQPNAALENMVDFVELLEDESKDLGAINPLPSAACFTEFLRKRALDESVYVRKNSIQVIVNILKFSADLLQEDLVSILSEHCRDSSLMVRKLISGALTDLLKTYPTNDMVIRHWVDGLFPLILDVEQKAAEKVLESVWECLFGNLVKYSASGKNVHFLPWKILQSSEELKMTKYLSRACGIWAKEGQLKANVIDILKTHIHTENNDLTWLILSLISGHVTIPDPHFVMEYFNTSIHTPEGVGLYTLLQVLRVLFASVIRLSQNEQTMLQKDLVLLVKRFAIPPELIPTAVDIATVVSSIEAGGGSDSSSLKAYQTKVDGWTVEIIEAIDHDLSEKILNPSGEDVEDVQMMRKIFTLGELAQISPQKINKRLFLLMQSIIFQQGTKHRRPKKGVGTQSDGQSQSQAPVAVPSSQTQSSQPPPCAFQPTTRLQALAIVTLAKMCLQHEDMAKKIIPAFGQILDTSNDNAVKNNIMYALTDMCVRYASLVDPLIPQITACLKDDSLVVRRSTLITLIHLLQEDYLKMSGRGAFFFRIMQTLNDDSDEMRHLTTFYLQQRLIKRKPKVMFQHFTEALFHFNEYESHETYNKFNISEREKRLFSMRGPEYRHDRMKLYKFMLENMSDEQRFQTTYRLCKDILGGAVEGQVILGLESFDLLQDAFACLSCEEIKLASLKSKVDEDEGQPSSQTDDDMSGAIQSALKKNLISQVVKKNVIENIIPIIISLKHKLEELESGLLDDLMNYLRELMKDYKNEVKDMLAADKQLATEIESDLKKWEEEQKKIEEARREAEAQDKSPSRRDLLLRAVVESAVNVFQEKQKEKERRKEAGEIIDDDSISSQGDLMDKFLTKNVGKPGSNPANISTMLSPRLVIQDVMSPLQASSSKSMREKSSASPRSVSRNSGERSPTTAKRKLTESFNDMVVAEESILMTEADQENLASEVLSELHAHQKSSANLTTTVPSLAEINRELEVAVNKSKRLQRKTPKGRVSVSDKENITDDESQTLASALEDSICEAEPSPSLEPLEQELEAIAPDSPAKDPISSQSPIPPESVVCEPLPETRQGRKRKLTDLPGAEASPSQPTQKKAQSKASQDSRGIKESEGLLPPSEVTNPEAIAAPVLSEATAPPEAEEEAPPPASDKKEADSLVAQENDAPSEADALLPSPETKDTDAEETKESKPDEATETSERSRPSLGGSTDDAVPEPRDEAKSKAPLAKSKPMAKRKTRKGRSRTIATQSGRGPVVLIEPLGKRWKYKGIAATIPRARPASPKPSHQPPVAASPQVGTKRRSARSTAEVEEVESSPPKRRRIMSPKLQKSPAKSRVTSKMASRLSLVVKAVEMETANTPERSYGGISRLQKEIKPSRNDEVHQVGNKKKKKRALPLLKPRKRTRGQNQRATTSSEDEEVSFNFQPQPPAEKDPEDEISFKLPDPGIVPSRSILSNAAFRSSRSKEVSFKAPSLNEISSASLTTRRFQLSHKAQEKRRSLASMASEVDPLRSKAQNVLRAISTPKAKGVSQGDLTFLEQSHDLSAIPILSPPSTRKKRGTKPQSDPTDESAVSFKFGRTRQDPFVEMLKRDENHRRASNEEAGQDTSLSRVSPRSRKPNKRYLN